MKRNMKRKIHVIMAVVSAFVLCLTLASCGSFINLQGGDAAKQDIKKVFVGTWELTQISGATEEDIAILKAYDMAVEATFSDDGVFKMDFLGDVAEGTWEAKSDTHATLTFEGNAIEGDLKDGELTFTYDGDTMTLKKISDEVEDITAAGLGDSTAAGGNFDDEEVQAVDTLLVDDENVTITVVDKKKDWIGECGYTLRIANNSADTTIDVDGEFGTWSVNGKMVYPYFYETIKPGAYAETFVSFSDDTIQSLSDLTNVEGTIELLEEESYSTIAKYPVTLD